MAAAVETSNQRYYCHQCEQTISPTKPELLCPTCHLGFIEEVSSEESMEMDDEDSTETPSTHSDEMRMHHNIFQRHFGEMPPGRPSRRRRLHGRGRPSPSQPNVFGHFAALDQILQIFGYEGQAIFEGRSDTSQGAPNFLNLFQIHGNPADYAWGGRGLDSIITRLLEQMEGSGPPPAEPDKIAALPTVNITQSDIDANLECPVCKELFTLNEEVKTLPCKHYFHEMCITPWLEKHDSCPICRLSLNGSKSNVEL